MQPNIKGILLEAKIGGWGITYGHVYEVHEVEDLGSHAILHFLDDNLEESEIVFDFMDDTYNEDLFNVYFQI